MIRVVRMVICLTTLACRTSILNANVVWIPALTSHAGVFGVVYGTILTTPNAPYLISWN